MRKPNPIYVCLADVLDPRENTETVIEALSLIHYNWAALVKLASSHLVIPAFSENLKRKHLWNSLPDDLKSYLNYITDLNNARNQDFVTELTELAALFKKHHINYALVKGSAMLMSGYYDIKERMLGDIDVIVADKDLERASELLINKGYVGKQQTEGNTFFEHKHLPRLTHENKIAAIELHRKLYNKHIDPELTTDQILKHKQNINGVYIASNQHLLKHAIQNWQINDLGFYHGILNYRTAYDVNTLLQHTSIPEHWQKNKYIRSFFNVHAPFITLYKNSNFPLSYSIKSKCNVFLLSHTTYYTFWHKLLKLKHNLWLLASRIPLFIRYKRYRKFVYDDRKRLAKKLKQLIFKP